MSQQNLTLAYLNEDDRAYGLAGMMISLASLNAIDRVAEICLDSDGPMVEFSHEFYFQGSPSISPKATWDNLHRNGAVKRNGKIRRAPQEGCSGGDHEGDLQGGGEGGARHVCP